MQYTPSITGQKFHDARDVDTGFVRLIFGPIGSGKSVTCALELILIAMNQEPDSTNTRRTKFAIIRNTYRELLDTTVATFFTWVDKDTGHWSAQNMVFTLEQTLQDGTTLYSEFLFRALDKPDDIKKLLSLEITAAWINEAREIARAVVDMVQGRVGRYPPPVLGVDPTFFGVIMDTNPPDSDHWIYSLFEEDIPQNHKLFKQPSGLSAQAENVENLPRNYYINMMAGKNKDWIDVYVRGVYGFIASGKPVYPEYNEHLHYSDDVVYDPKLSLCVGLDFGLTPAAVFIQIAPSGQIRIIDELATFDMGSVSFGNLLSQRLNTTYKASTHVEIYGDPAGDQRSQTNEEHTPFIILRNMGINAWPTYTNDPLIRVGVVAAHLTKLDFTGNPAIIVGPLAKTVRKGFTGGYKYKRQQVTGDERYQDTPDKNKYSHTHDALQYVVLGAVGDSSVIGGSKSKKLDYSNTIRRVR